MKTKNKANSDELKKQVCIRLDGETVSKCRKLGLNLSRFTEKALNWLYLQIEEGFIKVFEGNTLILNSDCENTALNEWSRRDLNTCSPACKAESNFVPELDKSAEFADFEKSKNFSTLARVSELRSNPYMSIGEFMSDKKEKFLAFCLHTKPATTDLGTRQAYYNKLVTMTDIYTPEDVAKLGTTTKTVLRALSKFYNFVETKYYAEGFNGFPKAQWIGNQKEANYAEGSRADTKTKDLTPEEVRAGYDYIFNAEVKFYYLLAACSGARSAHLYKWLKSKDRKIEKLDGGIIRADVRDTSAGTKEEVYFYFPAELLPKINKFKLTHGIDYFEKQIQRAGTADRKINISSLRKWNFNLLLEDSPQITANAIQGRAMKGIDEKHYFDAAGSGARHYPATANKLRGIFPL